MMNSQIENTCIFTIYNLILELFYIIIKIKEKRKKRCNQHSLLTNQTLNLICFNKVIVEEASLHHKNQRLNQLIMGQEKRNSCQ